LGNGLLQDAVMAAMMGFSGGTVFAAGLAVSERHGSLSQIRLRTGALWGLLAGFAGPGGVALLLGDFWQYVVFVSTTPLFLGTFLVLGAGSGVAMTAIAKSENNVRLGSPDLVGLPDEATQGAV
jgi:hypothetical protein